MWRGGVGRLYSRRLVRSFPRTRESGARTRDDPTRWGPHPPAASLTSGLWSVVGSPLPSPPPEQAPVEGMAGPTPWPPPWQGRGMAGGAGGVLAEEARTRGGARPRAGRNLDGRMHFVRCRPNPRPLPWQGRGVCVAISSGAGVGLRLAPQGRGGGHDLAPLSSPRYAGGQRDLVLGMHGAGVGGVSVGVRVSQGVGSGRSARQDYLAQPAQAGRQGDGGDSHGTQTVLTRHPGRGGRGYVGTRCPMGGARTVMPRRAG